MLDIDLATVRTAPPTRQANDDIEGVIEASLTKPRANLTTQAIAIDGGR